MQKVTAGVGLRWGRRENFADDLTSDVFRVQLSFKDALPRTFGGQEATSSPGTSDSPTGRPR